MYSVPDVFSVGVYNVFYWSKERREGESGVKVWVESDSWVTNNAVNMINEGWFLSFLVSFSSFHSAQSIVILRQNIN